jgi:hypothetical protein
LQMMALAVGASRDTAEATSPCLQSRTLNNTKYFVMAGTDRQQNPDMESCLKVAASVDVRCKREKAETAAIT